MKTQTLGWPHVCAPLTLADTPDTRAFQRLAGKTEDLAPIQAQANALRARCTTMVLVGAGGSGMSGKLLATLARDTAFQVHVLDNLDVEAVTSLLRRSRAEETCVVLVSKSGTTTEVIALGDILVNWLRHAGCPLAAHVCVITMEDGNVLHRFACEEGVPLLGCDPALGGRFSVLSAVGLLPAAFTGVNIAALRRGAAVTDASTIGAAVAAQQQLIQHGRTNHVMMIYNEALLPFACWWQQVFSESLGKDGKGAGAVVALGPRDQHSQLQRYMEGPDNCYFTIVSCGQETVDAPLVSHHALLPLLRGKSLQAMVDAMRQGTIDSLAHAGKAVRHLHLPTLDEASAGVFLQSMMLEVVALGEALGINPFGQPAVELSKRLTRDYLK